jgi:hypothetical protein
LFEVVELHQAVHVIEAINVKNCLCKKKLCSAWLSDGENPLITRISQRAGAIANLTLESAEQMQVCTVYD